MDGWSRRLRGLLGVATSWAVAWGVIGGVVGLLIAALTGGSPTWTASIAEWAMGIGAYGFVSGLGFGGLLAYHERRKTIDDLSPARAAMWGVLGAVLVPLLFGLLGFFEPDTTLVDVLEAMGVTTLLGGSFAAGSVALARRTAPGDQELGALESTDGRALQAARTEEPAPRRRERAWRRL